MEENFLHEKMLFLHACPFLLFLGYVLIDNNTPLSL